MTRAKRAPDDAAKQLFLEAAEALERDADDVADGLATFLAEHVDEIGPDPRTHADAVRHGRAGLAALTRAIRLGVPPEDAEPGREALDYSRTLAARGVPLSVVVRVYRIALGYVVEAIEERLGLAEASTDVLLAATLQSTDYLFAANDALVARLSDVYEHERERWVGAAEALRHATIAAILGNHSTEADVASRALAYELRRHHLGLVLWATDGEDPGAHETLLRATVDSVAERLGGGRALVYTDASDSVSAWVGFSSAPSADVLDRVEATRGNDAVRIAIGNPAYGLSGFQRTHVDAMDAAAVSRLAGGSGRRVTLYRSVRVAALFARDPDRARRFVRGQLGGLGVDNDEHARLRATLTVYLDESGSRLATAKRLGIHPNTVANRVRAARALLDHEAGESRVELRAALRLAVTLGPAVLRDARPGP
jgi:DNA-binding PucR family transcriptional regulator